MNQKGYTRLYGVLSLMAMTVVSVLLYQSVVYRTKTSQTDVIVKSYTRVQVFPHKLPQLSQGAYELWVVADGNDYSLGKFQLDADHQLISATGEVQENTFTLPEDLTNIEGAKITLSDSLDPRSGENILFLQGGLAGDRASLMFLESFEQATGQYMLATPTDNNSLVNERSGVWFGDVLRSTPTLSLPHLPSGWVYEGWAVVNGDTTLTTGSFIETTSSDAFTGFSDRQGITPNFPGEDFLKDPPVEVFPGLTFPLDLADQRIELTIEPRDSFNQDPTGAGKFPYTVLAGRVPKRAEAFQLFPLEQIEDLPTALVVFR